MEFYRNKSSGALFVEHPVQEDRAPGPTVLLIAPSGAMREVDAHLCLALDQPGSLESTPEQRQTYTAALRNDPSLENRQDVLRVLASYRDQLRERLGRLQTNGHETTEEHAP